MMERVKRCGETMYEAAYKSKNGKKHEVFDACRLSRFAEGKLSHEDMILG